MRSWRASRASRASAGGRLRRHESVWPIRAGHQRLGGTRRKPATQPPAGRRPVVRSALAFSNAFVRKSSTSSLSNWSQLRRSKPRSSATMTAGVRIADHGEDIVADQVPLAELVEHDLGISPAGRGGVALVERCPHLLVKERDLSLPFRLAGSRRLRGRPDSGSPDCVNDAVEGTRRHSVLPVPGVQRFPAPGRSRGRQPWFTHQLADFLVQAARVVGGGAVGATVGPSAASQAHHRRCDVAVGG